jgi:hypothetical protein
VAELADALGSGPSPPNGGCRFNSCLRHYLRQFGQRVRIRFSANTAPSRRFRGGTRRWPGCGRIGRCRGARSPPPPAPRSRRREPQPTDTRCAACAGPRPARRRAGRTARRGCERRRDASERPGDDPHAVPGVAPLLRHPIRFEPGYPGRGELVPRTQVDIDLGPCDSRPTSAGIAWWGARTPPAARRSRPGRSGGHCRASLGSGGVPPPLVPTHSARPRWRSTRSMADGDGRSVVTR